MVRVKRAMSAEDSFQDPPRFSSTRLDDQGDSIELRRRTMDDLGRDSIELRRRTTMAHSSPNNTRIDINSPLLITLLEAEVAASSAAVQLVSFRDAMEDEFSDSRQSASDNYRFTRQRCLLLEKLEDFKRINKSVRQHLKEIQKAEADRIRRDEQIEVLVEKITEAESENMHLKRCLCNTENRIEELVDLRTQERANMESAVNMTRSVEATRAHLHGQLRNKESENSRLAVQLRNLEGTLVNRKMEIGELKSSVAALSERVSEDKETLTRAARAHKRRAERFEAAVEKCYTQLREKDVQLADVCAERDSWRNQQRELSEEKEQLVIQTTLLKAQMVDVTARQQGEREEFTEATKTLFQRVEKLSSDHATLKAHTAHLERKLSESEAAQMEEKAVSQEKKHQAEAYLNQLTELRDEMDVFRTKHESLSRQTENEKIRKDADAEKVRQELQGCVEVLRETQHSLCECQEKLRHSERKCSEKSEAIRQLQVQLDSETKKLKSSLEMKESIHEANSQLQERVACIQKRTEDLLQENQALVHRLTDQEEALTHSHQQADQRSADCHALKWQLESTLSDVRLQISKVKESAVSREAALQTKILQLEAEKSRKETELKLLKHNKQSAEKQFEMRLKEVQLSLDQSESHKKSIQGYIDFLKNSYAIMFDEGSPQPRFGSSNFLK